MWLWLAELNKGRQRGRRLEEKMMSLSKVNIMFFFIHLLLLYGNHVILSANMQQESAWTQFDNLILKQLLIV